LIVVSMLVSDATRAALSEAEKYWPRPLTAACQRSSILPGTSLLMFDVS
jgi:hypothetical protein